MRYLALQWRSQEGAPSFLLRPGRNGYEFNPVGKDLAEPMRQLGVETQRVACIHCEIFIPAAVGSFALDYADKDKPFVLVAG